MYETIVWATDGSGGADAALAEARRLAELTGARILAVHCDQRMTGRAGAWSVLPDEDDRRGRIRREVEAARHEGVPIDLVVVPSRRSPAETVTAVAAERDAQLIVCSTRGRRAVAAAALGSFTHRILRLAPCPVVVVPVLPARRRSPSLRGRREAGPIPVEAMTT